MVASMAITPGLMLKKFRETVGAARGFAMAGIAKYCALLLACTLPLCVATVWPRLGAAEVRGDSRLLDTAPWRCVLVTLPRR